MDIVVERLSKVYKVNRKNPGIRESIKALFHREYTAIEAVKDISFTLTSGEIVGFIGPNGSGKTTTMKMLSGLIRPSSGDIQAGAYRPIERKKDFLKQIGFVMGQKGQLWWDLPALDSFMLLSDIYDCDKSGTMKYVYELAERLSVTNFLKQPVRMLSLGQRMKVELIGSILHKPQILLLDEPTIGLDMNSARSIRQIIREEVSERDMIVVLSSHILDDIQELCKRVIIINNGNLVYDDLLKKCYDQFLFQKRIQVKFKVPVTRERLIYSHFVTEFTPYEVCWEVERNLVSKISYEIMQNMTIDDITISEIPLGKVIEFITDGGCKPCLNI